MNRSGTERPLVWTFAPLGDSGVLLLFRGPQTDTTAVARVHAALRRERLPGVVDLVPTVESLLVCYDPLATSFEELRLLIDRRVADESFEGQAEQRVVDIEVDYGGDSGPDLAAVAAACGLDEAEVIALHTVRPMPVLLIGFMPGFPYIGELPSPLRLPRRSVPRTMVAAGSVAIANDQTGIYPSRSPGGWHIIGRTTATLFDPRRDPPALLGPGDWVRFVARASGA